MQRTTDQFSWNAPYGGDWTTPANWLDTTIGSLTATTAPGAAGTVSIIGGTSQESFADISGTGAAAQLSVAYDVLLWGTVAVGGALTLLSVSDLELDGASLTAGSITSDNDGPFGNYTGNTLEVDDGSTLTLAGALHGSGLQLAVVDGSVMQVGTLVLDAAGTSVVDLDIGGDASLEVGTLGDAALGALTIDPGQSAAVTGAILGSVVSDGTLGVQAGQSLIVNTYTQGAAQQDISGSGVLAISEGSALTLDIADSAAIQFAGPKGTLTLGVLPTGTITGFGVTDAIDVAGLAVGLSAVQTTPSLETLTLWKNHQVVGTLALAGNYGTGKFHLSVTSGLITLQTLGAAPVPPTLIAGTPGADSLAATADRQVLTGLGGGDTMNATGFTGLVFRDTAADLSGDTISDFAASDSFDITDLNPAKATVSYDTTDTLTVTDGTLSATVDLSFSYGNSNDLLPIGYFATASDGTGGTSVSYVAVNTHNYAWNASADAYYSNGAKWQDTTVGIKATLPPSYGNNVTIAGLTGEANIAGNGAAASLTTTGAVLLLGTLAVGTKVGYVSGALTQSGTLALDHYASLSLAGTVAIAGLTDVAGGSTLTAASVGQSSGTLEATGYGAVTFTGMDETVYGAVLGVDSLSSIEFGPYFSPVRGALKVDSGTSLGMTGTIDGNVVVNGTLTTDNRLAIESYGSTASSVSGFGTLEITTGDALELTGSDSAAIMFAPSYYYEGGTLELAGNLPTGRISGFSQLDSIVIDRTVTGMSFSQTGSTGELTLTDGATTLGTLTLAGTYNGAQFLLLDSPGAGTATLTYLPVPTAQSVSPISSTSDNYAWESSGSGAWGNAANWFDTTTDQAVTTAPGIDDTVYIYSYSQQVISGNGSAASVDLTGYAEAVLTGAIKVAGSFTTSSGVVLASGASVIAGTLENASTLQISGGSTLTANFASNIGTTTVIGGSKEQIDAVGNASVYGTITVDSTSSFEIGSSGATKGAFSIDAGQTLTAQYGDTTIEGAFVVIGTHEVAYYSETIEGLGGTTGAISGSGTIVVANQGQLTLNATDSAALLLTGDFDFLELAGPLPTGTLTGFVTNDTIQIDHGATGLSYSQTTPTHGILTLTDGAQTLGTIALAGSYYPGNFQLDVSPLTGVASITLLQKQYADSSGPFSTSSDAYLWSGGSGESWSIPANWHDVPKAATATAPPGSHDNVTINGFSTVTTIGGPGAAAALTITGDIMLTGTVAASGVLSVASGGTLALANAASLTAAAASFSGEVEVGDASSAAIAGTATLTGGTLMALDGSTIALGGLVGSGTAIVVDDNSIIAVGSTTGAAQGAFTVQTSLTAALAGSLAGSVVAAGTLAVVGGGTLTLDIKNGVESDPYAASPTITGGGTLVLTEASSLGLGVADSAAISFAGPNATLRLAALPTGTISGFTTGDQIQVDQTVTGIGYNQVTAAAGTLTLYDGTASVGTLALAGSYNGAGTLFHLQTVPDGSSALITLQTVGITQTQPTLIAGTPGSDVLTATAAGQTVTGLGGDDSLNSAGLGSVTFKDLTANLNGSSILNIVTSDAIDFTDLSFASAVKAYSGSVLTVGDGTHAATISVGFATAPGSGSFAVASDGGSGTTLTWHS